MTATDVDTRAKSAAPLVTTILGAVCLAAFSLSGFFAPDGYWHLAAGELILDDLSIPGHDSFSWTAAGESWRLNSWLYDVVAASLERVGGRAAVTVLMLAATVAYTLVAYGICRLLGSRPWSACAAALTVGFVVLPLQTERPQSLSFLLFGACFVARGALGGSNRALLALASAVLLWSNLHLAFTAGIALVAAMAFAALLHDGAWKRPTLVLATALVAGLLNPYGLGAYTAAFDVRGRSTVVYEWQRLDPSDPVQLLAVIVTGLGILALVRTGRWRRLEVVIPLATFVVLTIDAWRNFPFLLLLVAPEIAIGLSRFEKDPGTENRAPSPLVVGLQVGFVLAALLFVVGGNGLYGADEERVPVDAVAAIPAGCRLLNEYGDGGYIIYKRWPDVLVAQDGRNDMYGEERIDELENVLDGREGWKAWIDDNRVDCVLVDADRPIVTGLADAGWLEVERDPAGVLLRRP